MARKQLSPHGHEIMIQLWTLLPRHAQQLHPNNRRLLQQALLGTERYVTASADSRPREAGRNCLIFFGFVLYIWRWNYHRRIVFVRRRRFQNPCIPGRRAEFLRSPLCS